MTIETRLPSHTHTIFFFEAGRGNPYGDTAASTRYSGIFKYQGLSFMCVLQGRGRLRRWIPATKSNEDLQFTNEGKLFSSGMFGLFIV